MEEELDGQTLQMNLACAGKPIVFLRLETYDAFKDLADACREMQERLMLPWQKERVTREERCILEAMAALDRAIEEAKST